MRSDGGSSGATLTPTTPPKVTIQFLQDQHRAVLGALAGELDKLKVENRDLKFRLVMRDTATPKAKTRAPAANSNGAAAADVVAMRTELSELRQKNATMEQEQSESRAASANEGAYGLENELEMNRVNKLNFDLLSEVAALRHELKVQLTHSGGGRGADKGSSSRRRTSSGSHPNDGTGGNSGGGGSGGDRLSQSLPPMGLTSASGGVVGSGGSGSGGGGGGSAARQPGLKDYGILKTGANNQPRILNRRRASGDQNGRTRRKLVPVPQPATLKPLNVGESFGAGLSHTGFHNNNSSSSSTGSSSNGRRK